MSWKDVSTDRQDSVGISVVGERRFPVERFVRFSWRLGASSL